VWKYPWSVPRNKLMLSLVIQAGGESRRMGQDKALMPFLGRPLIQRVAERLAPIADELIVTTNRPDAYRFLGRPLFADLQPGGGALGGLFTALSVARYPLVAVVACDMPFANPDLLAFARDLMIETRVDVVIPSTAHGLEPLHAVYRRDACLPAIRTAMQAEQWKVISWFPQVRVHQLEPQEIGRFDPDGLTFWNLNTPQEFKQAERRARDLAT
jgi:molybdopterin-guanine dinucleotide biosynthesis protein A